MTQLPGAISNVMQKCIPFNLRLAIFGAAMGPSSVLAANGYPPERGPIHPVHATAELASQLADLPITRDFPPDFIDTLRGEAPAFIIEMSTSPGCIPCADAWAKLGQIHARFGWKVAALNRMQAMERSGRLGLPWVGDPVVWVRPIVDGDRTIPVAIGTDLLPNLERNIYLGTKMLTGVRAQVGVAAMSRFTGIVGAGP